MSKKFLQEALKRIEEAKRKFVQEKIVQPIDELRVKLNDQYRDDLKRFNVSINQLEEDIRNYDKKLKEKRQQAKREPPSQYIQTY
jgi:uncharacterized protein YaaN involved in tellurite resistance